MNQYRKGANFERKVVNKARANPECVYAARIAGSHSAFDIIVIWEYGLIELIQCKTGKVTKTILKNASEKMPSIPHTLNPVCKTITPQTLHRLGSPLEGQ